MAPSPLTHDHMEIPQMPSEHELTPWPAKLRYILGRNALRANRPSEARHYFLQSLRLKVSSSALFLLVASFLGKPVNPSIIASMASRAAYRSSAGSP